MGIKITMAEFEEFEKQFLFEKIKNPDYRLGQAFSNTFGEIANSMENDGDLGYAQANELWNCDDRTRVLEILDWYVIR
jgi:hypothetical protein